MWSVAKAQFYQLKKERILLMAFVAIFLLECLIIFMSMLTAGKIIPAGDILAGMLSVSMMFPLLFTMLLTATVCCGDFADKTLNYELLTGHTRAESCFGRALVSVLLSVPLFYLLAFLPSVISGCLFGWGSEATLHGIITRAAVMVFPVIRIVCEFVFLSFLVKKKFIVMLIGFLLTMLTNSMPIISESTSPLLGCTCMNSLTKIESWAVFGLENNLHMIYETALPAETIVTAVGSSLAAAALFLLLGYRFFRYDDIE